MAVEAVDARHEAILCLERARIAVEAGDTHMAETHAQSAIAWLHEVAGNLHLDDISREPDTTRDTTGWQYRP